jgi:hypothetical protein
MQRYLFKKEQLNDWQEEWNEMPEFKMEKIEPFSKIIIRFETEKDLKEFANIINQKLTKKTKSIWFPYKSHFRKIKKIWKNEQ